MPRDPAPAPQRSPDPRGARNPAKRTQIRRADAAKRTQFRRDRDGKGIEQRPDSILPNEPNFQADLMMVKPFAPIPEFPAGPGPGRARTLRNEPKPRRDRDGKGVEDRSGSFLPNEPNSRTDLMNHQEFTPI